MISEIKADFTGTAELVDGRTLQEILPPGAIHQGIAIQTRRLREPDLADILEADLDTEGTPDIILILDQVTDPQNVGAILRSAAAFRARAVILTERNGAPESGSLAKAASGALDIVPLVRVNNLARAMAAIADAGYWRYGLDGEADKDLAAMDLTGKIALVLGAEGAGMRRLTREHCDLLCRLPIDAAMESLNVSNAAAIALYEIRR